MRRGSRVEGGGGGCRSGLDPTPTPDDDCPTLVVSSAKGYVGDHALIFSRAAAGDFLHEFKLYSCRGWGGRGLTGRGGMGA